MTQIDQSAVYQKENAQLRAQVETLSEQARLLQAIVDHTPDLVCTIDVDGVYTLLSPSFRDVLGYGPQDLLGRWAFEFMHPDDRDRVNAILAPIMTDGGAGIALFRYAHADGQYLWFESRGKALWSEGGTIIGVVIISRNVTDQLQLQQNLVESRQQLRAVLDATDQAFLLLGRDRHMVTLNRATEQIYQVIMGGNLRPGDPVDSIFIYFNLLDYFLANFRRACDGEKVYVERALKLADGKAIWFSFTYNPVFSESGEVSHVCLNIANIAQRKEIEQHLLMQQDKDRQFAERLTALHAINMQLSRAVDWQELCKLAVLTARDQFFRGQFDQPNAFHGPAGSDYGPVCTHRR
ncbi:MAG: PAS domain S-box protein [Anaerolineales bacterium]|nr:PAS domain S-box protein [Anaerolineales bacterium]